MIGPVRLFSGLVLLGCVSSQHVFEEHRHMAQPSLLDHIPTQFEIRGNHPQKEFEKYANRIHNLAKHENKTVIYKIKVEVAKFQNSKNRYKKNSRKGKSMKFNVPLKKKSMKLSHFEAIVKKMASEANHAAPSGNSHKSLSPTTEPHKYTTKLMHTKYRPVISKLNNFSKVVKPVRNRIITLTN